MVRGGSRGRKKPKLRDLSRYMPTPQEMIALERSIVDAHPVAVAILAAVMVEHDLERLLQSRLAGYDDNLWLSLTEDNGPIGTFHRKIEMARALRIVDPTTQHNLHIVRVIRNAFAHSKVAIDFDHELILAELSDIQIPGYAKRGHRACKALKPNARTAYTKLCFHIEMHLIGRDIKTLSLKARRRSLKNDNLSPLARLFMSNPDAHLSPSELSQQLTRPDPTSGPTPSILQQLTGGLFGLGEEASRKKDK
jgi:hypothetical protein